MCGIVGVISQTERRGFILFKNLLQQSQIRGKHSTGISWTLSQGKVGTTIDDIPAKEFVKRHLSSPLKSDLNLYLGHTRYSTSDLRYGQPITIEGKESISHNGVISQADPETWEKLYGYKNLKTLNDSELLLRFLRDGENNKESISEKFPDASIAYGTISSNRLTCYRNGHRPLWIACVGYGDAYMFASTKDIIVRALRDTADEDPLIFNADISYWEAEIGVQYIFKHSSTRILVKQERPAFLECDKSDLQTISKISKHYIGE